MEFDYQWENLPDDPNLTFVDRRMTELLRHTGLRPVFFRGKYCLDVGCGTGRWTWAMLKLGAKVDSFDISAKAVEACRRINPGAYVFDLMRLEPSEKYDFVLCWGVLHHLASPVDGFERIAAQVKLGGLLHIMVYHEDTQWFYVAHRKVWPSLTEKQKFDYCKKLISEYGGTIHGWWDALNPQYNWSFRPDEVKKWFRSAGFVDVVLVRRLVDILLRRSRNINMRGQKG